MVVPDKIVRSKRRSLALVVDSKGRLIVRAPLRMPLARIDSFIAQKQNWILKKQREAAGYRAAHPPFVAQPGRALSVLGRRYTILFHTKKRVAENSTTLFLPAADAQRSLVGWLKKRAREAFLALLNERASEMGLRYETLKLSNAATRWGSCSGKNAINLNWRLVLCPLEVADYVVVHELAHVAQKNHGAAFWALVGRYCPDYQEQRRWLKENRFLLDWFR